MAGVSYQPVALLSKQTVAGTNYVYLCQGQTATARPKVAWYILTASKSLNNMVAVRSVKKNAVGSIKTVKNPRSAAICLWWTSIRTRRGNAVWNPAGR